MMLRRKTATTQNERKEKSCLTNNIVDDNSNVVSNVEFSCFPSISLKKSEFSTKKNILQMFSGAFLPRSWKRTVVKMFKFISF